MGKILSMECPKCGKEVSDDAKVCPHCKKVLKLVCPKCETANPTPVCTKCGFTILSKCEKCGAITPTIKGVCSKCGFSTYASIAMASSNIDQFACVTVDFTNLDDIREVMGSKRLIEKFNNNLDSMIVNFCNDHEIRREIIDGTYVLKFNKNDSFNESALEAMSAAIDLSKNIIFMNFKLQKAKSISLECKMAILKRDVNTLPEHFQSGFDIKLVTNYPKEFRYLNAFQIFTDSHIYQEVSDTYSLNSLSSSYINGEMVTFFELNLKKHLKVEEPKEEEETEQLSVTQLEEIKETLIDEHEEIENKLYNKDVIIFDDMKCSFSLSNAYDIDKLVLEEITQKNKQIIMLKSTQNFKPESDRIISLLEEKKVAAKIYKVACYDMMKYKPYGFFSELITVMNGFSRTPKLSSSNNFSVLASLDQKNMLNSMINSVENSSADPEESRAIMFDIFSKIVNSVGNVVIYINNFELIDESSYELLKLIWQNLPQNIKFIASIDIDYAFHKTSHFLLQNERYSEIRLKPLSIKRIVECEAKRFSAFSNTYYFTNVLQSMKGSYLFFNMAMSYLKQKNIISEEKDGISVISNNTCVIPTDAEHLMVKRLQTLQKSVDSFNLFSMIALSSPMSDLKTLQLFEIKTLNDSIKELNEFGFITVSENNVYVKNYDIAKRALDKVLKPEEKQALINELLSKVYSNSLKTVEEFNLYTILNDTNSEQSILEFLSQLSAGLGDFSAYLNCTVQLMKLLEKTLDDETKEETLETFKMNVYENVSKMLNKYTPRKIYSVSKNILSNLEKSDDLTKLVAFSIKMLKTSMLCGSYGYTLDLVNKVLARLSEFSMNPAASNFNASYFLITMVRIEALFSVGRMRECEEVGNEVIGYLKAPNIFDTLPEGVERDEYETVIINAMTFVTLSKVFLLRKDETIKMFIDEVKAALPNAPSHFDLMPAIKDVMLGKEITIDLNSQNEEKFTKIIKATLRGFTADKEDSTRFANDIYEAKICANINDYSQLEILFDLLIGYAYFKLQSLDKAKVIYYNVIELSEVNGFKLAGYIACYLLSMLYYSTGETETALGLANNTVSHIEKDNNVGDYLFYLFRVLTSGIYMDLGDEDKALACTQSAVFVKKKDDVVFGLENVDIEAVERRVNDRRKVKEDVGGRRKGQRRITDDMQAIENMPQENQAAQAEDTKMLKDLPKESAAKKNTMLDDMKKLENIQMQDAAKKQKEEELKLLKEKQAEEKKKESELKKAAAAEEKLRKEQEKLRKKQEEEKALLGDTKMELKG